MRLLVTGAGGFIGRAVAVRAIKDGWTLRTCYHAPIRGWTPLGESTIGLQLSPDADWSSVLVEVDVVVHCAARVHVLHETASDPLSEFRRVNAAGTINLARQAANARVRRFVFLSSIGVNGAETFDTPFRADDVPAPHSDYALSKYEAEKGLNEIAGETDMEVVIVRPPLVYGPGVPGNFERMMRLLFRGIPLPLGAVHNRRSLVALSNLVDLISTVASHPAAGNRTLLVSDGEDVSTAQLFKLVGAALGKPVRLFPVPPSILRQAAKLVGRTELARQLCGSLQVDISKTCQFLQWMPPVRMDAALQEAAKDFIARQDALADGSY